MYVCALLFMLLVFCHIDDHMSYMLDIVKSPRELFTRRRHIKEFAVHKLALRAMRTPSPLGC